MLHLNGRAYATDDSALLATMTTAEQAPKAALVMRVKQTRLTSNEAVRSARLWDPSVHVDPSAIPDLMGLGAQHLARNKANGAKATMTRLLSRGMAAAPKLVRRAAESGYRRDLCDEGFGP